MPLSLEMVAAPGADVAVPRGRWPLVPAWEGALIDSAVTATSLVTWATAATTTFVLHLWLWCGVYAPALAARWVLLSGLRAAARVAAALQVFLLAPLLGWARRGLRN